MHHRAVHGLAVMVIMAALAGCAPVGGSDGSGVPAGPSLPAAVPSATALLDWATAGIQLPLDQYGMSDEELQVVTAALNILVHQCVSGEQAVSSEVLAQSRETMSEQRPAQDWSYGFWDAPFVATSAVMAGTFERREEGGASDDFDIAKAKQCAQSEEYLSLGQIQSDYPATTEWEALFNYTAYAYGETVESSQFASLRDQRDQCIVEAGYMVNTDSTSELGGVAFLPEWTEEQVLAAKLVEATCSDAMGFTQQVADINAAFEQGFVDAYQAELVAIKELADSRVAKATQILQEAGAM